MHIKEVFRSKYFWINISIIIVVSVILVWLLFKFLDIYTRHGSNYVVPDFSGMTPEEIDRNPEYDIFNVIVFDSVYDNSLPSGVVMDQEPLPGTEVKPKRTIHLTVVSKQQEMVPLPDLGNTLRSAKTQLKAFGLVPGKIIEVPGEYDGFLSAAYYLGREIKQGELVPKSSKIDIEIIVDKKYYDDTLHQEDDFNFFQDITF